MTPVTLAMLRRTYMRRMKLRHTALLFVFAAVAYFTLAAMF